MARTLRQAVRRPCESPFCTGMAIIAAALATAVVVYSSAAILLLLR